MAQVIFMICTPKLKGHRLKGMVYAYQAYHAYLQLNAISMADPATCSIAKQGTYIRIKCQ